MQRLPVDCLFLPCGVPVEVPPDATLLALARTAIWHNGHWNRLIAGLARALVAGEHQKLRHWSPVLAQAVAKLSDPRVVVLVENVEHALALLPRLPGWSLLTGEVNTQGLNQAARNALKQAQPRIGQNSRLITTLAALPHLDLAQADVLVRADAGCSELPLTPLLLRRALPKSRRKQRPRAAGTPDSATPPTRACPCPPAAPARHRCRCTVAAFISPGFWQERPCGRAALSEPALITPIGTLSRE
jgi:hypothetical protein